ncbi:MAG TPA: methionine--tRNA ligase, partial [Acidobacteriaceae bacterium]|nr:methionine--tRNA ligase [Acidobacteriaceae bacterium]
MPIKTNKKPYYLTTPIYYVNARPHLGHTYTTVAADTIARYKRMRGFDVRFLTGTDEHGQKIERSAQKSGQGPQDFAAAVSSEFRSLWDRMGLTYDDYIRTTEERHKRGVQRLFTELKDRGFIYKGTYTGQYCVFDELYVDAPQGAPCPDCGRPTETVSEENYFFKLSTFERILLEYYDAHPEFIRPEARRNEVIAFVRGGLKDLSISRTSFNWGIPVPGDEKHVIYVWMDALANYITALGYGSDAPADKACFEKYWPADLHLIGKEISRFHCVYWPAFLMAAGLPLPKSIVAHGWLLFEQSKMSKSRGNIVRAETILDVLGADGLRYFLLREIAFGQDGGFSFDALVERYNADLANGYGNLASRTLTMIGKYFDGVVPAAPARRSEAAERVAELAAKVVVESNQRMDTLEFSRALESIWTLVAAVDGYITATAPWKLGAATDDASRIQLAEILYTSAETLRIITILAYPVLPQAASRIWSQIGLGSIAEMDLERISWSGLKPGTKIGELGPVFPRAEKDTIITMQSMEEKHIAETPVSTEDPTSKVVKSDALLSVAPTELVPAAATTSAPENAQASITAVPTKITIEDFSKVELRVAQIKVAERIKGADRLLRLEVDLGYEQRQIIAGIAEAYAPESLIGRKVVIVANLAPRKLRGFESNGMIVAASLGEKGMPVLAGFLEDIEIGA